MDSEKCNRKDEGEIDGDDSQNYVQKAWEFIGFEDQERCI